MPNKSSIEWTDATWNPVRGCTRVSEGCRYCYASDRKGGNPDEWPADLRVRMFPGEQWSGAAHD